MTKRKYRVLSLFSGGMGLDLGMEQTERFEIVACIEKDPSACATIRQNKDEGRLSPDMHILEADISQLDPEETLRELAIAPSSIDVVVGGPPCQSFSTAGNRNTTQDSRGTLLWDFLRFVSYIQPKIFLMENVRGLLSAALKPRPIAKRPPTGPPLSVEEEPGSVVRLFAHDLADAYHLDIFEVNAVNYGAPQLRERALFIGNRFGQIIDFPVPTHGPNDSEQGSLFDETLLLPWRTLRDAIGDLDDPNPEVLDFSPRKKRFLEMIPEGSNWRSLPQSVQQESMGKAWHAKGGRSGWWRRLTFDLPCPTLVTMPNHSSTSLCHPKETRALSLREYARIQEFPDEWVFSGTLSKKYAQIGNAVPTRLGKVAGEVLAKALDEQGENFSPVITNSEPRIVYLQSHVRTRQWFKAGETMIWKSGDENEEIRGKMPLTIKEIKKV